MKADTSSFHFLYSLQKSGIKAGLGNIRTLVSSLGHPQKRYPSVHVAGTNGKGSTAAMIASVLSTAGYRTGLYTSPHLVNFTERIRIDGRKIPMDRVAACTRRLRGEIRRTGATFFEATTAIAFHYFADEKIEIAVIETGLGGRWDSTNIVTPLVSVITSIGLEHQEYLGGTIRKIAFEKAGIIKRGTPCIVGNIRGVALDVISNRASGLGARVIRAQASDTVTNISSGLEGVRGDFRFNGGTIQGLHIAAAGTYQIGNTGIALKVLETLGKMRRGFPVGVSSIRRGLSPRGAISLCAGRLQLLRSNPVIIADVAHNIDGVSSLVDSLRGLYSGKFRIVFGVMNDKDYRGMIDLLRPLARMFYFVSASVDRSRDPRELLYYARVVGAPARLAGGVLDGMRTVLNENDQIEPILITGSHFIVGPAMESLNFSV